MKLFEVINGTLLGDASICVHLNKYYHYSLTAKSKEFLEWVSKIFSSFGIPTYITLSNKITYVYSLGFYINARGIGELMKLREKWYTKIDGKTVKIVPKELELTPTTLLFWYLGDGSLIRRRDNNINVPTIVLATNGFSKEDVEFLQKKLKELGLNFYIVKTTSLTGFRKEKTTNYLLYSSAGDDTPFRFFKLIGFECPKEIANCITGRKGKSHEIHFFKDKWPTKEDWIKILSNVKEVGPILRRRRLELGLSQNQLARKVGIRRENIRDVELMKRCFSVKNFRKILEALDLDVEEILKAI
jgi:DNA-binding XRE family transcriptional regulator